VDRIKNKRDVVKTTPNNRCETGGIESLNNYKMNPTIDSLNAFNDEKLYTHNNLDFSNFSISKNNFSKRYTDVLNEFSPSLEKNSGGLELNQKLNLMRIQSKLESKSRIASPKYFSSNKIQDLKYNYLKQENNSGLLNNNKRPLRTLNNLNSGCKSA